MTSLKKTALVIALFVAVAPLKAMANPGPVVTTFMTRVESHSAVRLADQKVSDDVYGYGLLSLYRQLDKNVGGSVYYIGQYSSEDEDMKANIAGVTVNQTLSGKWKSTYSFSYASNPGQDVNGQQCNQGYCQNQSKERFSTTLGYTLNPGSKTRARYQLKSSFGTNTNFSDGKTLAEQVSVSGALCKKANLSYEGSYQFIASLDDTATHVANQYSVDLTKKLSKNRKVVLGYSYVNDLGAGKDDDSVIRLSFFASKHFKF